MAIKPPKKSWIHAPQAGQIGMDTHRRWHKQCMLGPTTLYDPQEKSFTHTHIIFKLYLICNIYIYIGKHCIYSRGHLYTSNILWTKIKPSQRSQQVCSKCHSEHRGNHIDVQSVCPVLGHIQIIRDLSHSSKDCMGYRSARKCSLLSEAVSGEGVLSVQLSVWVRMF